MSKDVRVAEIPQCDVCYVLIMPVPFGPGIYNAPLSGEGQAQFGGSWANLCGPHFNRYGLDTSVTERRVKA